MRRSFCQRFFPEFAEYGFSDLYKDLFAALAVALMTIPQSLAYALLAGLPPMAGLYCAVVGTFFTSVVGTSRHLIAGPSTGSAILLQTAIAGVLYTYYPEVGGAAKQELVMQLLTQILFLVGVLQLLLVSCNVSKLLQFVSRPVILGYFAGITVVIGFTQLFRLTGVPSLKGDYPILFKVGYFFSHLHELQFPTLMVGLFSLFFLLFLRRFFPKLPNPLIVIMAASLLAEYLNHLYPDLPIETLAKFSLPEELSIPWALPFLELSLLPKIFPAALALAFLAILEVFSVSRTFAGKTGQKVQPNQDILGLGLGNFFLSWIPGAMISSGSATRTTLNYRMGAKTRLAALGSVFLTALLVKLFWPWVAKIPLTALAALLMATVHVLMDVKEIRFTFRTTREDAWVFFLTFISCLFLSLEIAFFVGIVISIASYLKRSASPILVEYAFNAKGRLMTVSSTKTARRQVRIIGIGGDLYFASADVFQSALETIAEDHFLKAIVLRLNNVHHMDASMCFAILRLHQSLKAKGRHFLISGLTEEVWKVFYRAGLVKEIGSDHLYFTDESNPQFSTWKACLQAQELIHAK